MPRLFTGIEVPSSVAFALSLKRGGLHGARWIDPENFNPNYLLRSVDLLPRRGDKPEWQHTQDYWTEKDALPAADLDDGCLRFE